MDNGLSLWRKQKHQFKVYEKIGHFSKFKLKIKKDAHMCRSVWDYVVKHYSIRLAVKFELKFRCFKNYIMFYVKNKIIIFSIKKKHYFSITMCAKQISLWKNDDFYFIKIYKFIKSTDKCTLKVHQRSTSGSTCLATEKPLKFVI